MTDAQYEDLRDTVNTVIELLGAVKRCAEYVDCPMTRLYRKGHCVPYEQAHDASKKLQKWRTKPLFVLEGRKP